jgi:hypothetical protein
MGKNRKKIYFFFYFNFILKMDNKIIACILYNNLTDSECKDKHNLICNLYQIIKSTLYRWLNEYK